MKTIKPFNSDDMRVKASERIHKMFKGAPFIYVKYKVKVSIFGIEGQIYFT